MLYGVTARSKFNFTGSRFLVVGADSEVEALAAARAALDDEDFDLEITHIEDLVFGQFDCIAELATVGH
jgi:hypothetical protein